MNKSPEPIILAVALVLLALGCATLAYLFPSVEALTKVTSTEPSGDRAKPLKDSDVESSLAVWSAPVLWQIPDDHHRLSIPTSISFIPLFIPTGTISRKLVPTPVRPAESR